MVKKHYNVEYSMSFIIITTKVYKISQNIKNMLKNNKQNNIQQYELINCHK